MNDRRIEKTLRKQTARLFKAMNTNGFARCDYPKSADGTIHILETNPNSGIFYTLEEPGSADFSPLNDKAYNHRKFMKSIICATQNRRDNMIAAKLLKKVKKQRVGQMACT